MFLSKKKQFDEQFHYFKIRKTSTINITYEPSLLRDAVSFSITHIQNSPQKMAYSQWLKTSKQKDR
jgi:hypothetical protein